MQYIKKYFKYTKYLLIIFVPLFIIVFSYVIRAIFNVGIAAGTVTRILASLC